jgi:hypothetical protein
VWDNKGKIIIIIIKPTRQSAWRGIFSPLTDPFYIFGHLFSVMASKNADLLASLASVLKNLSTPLHYHLKEGRKTDVETLRDRVSRPTKWPLKVGDNLGSTDRFHYLLIDTLEFFIQLYVIL